MSINLIVALPSQPPTGISGYTIGYQRIDIPNQAVVNIGVQVTTGYFPINNVANGQYLVSVTPVYINGQVCPPVTYTTPACTGITSFSASLSLDGTTINVTYNSSSPSVQYIAIFDNGSSNLNTVTTGSSIAIPVPSGFYGNVSITLSPVCDVASGFIGVASAPVLLSVPQPLGTVTATVFPTFGSGSGAVTSIIGITGFTLSGDLTSASPQSGTHYAATNQTISFVVTGVSTGGHVSLAINGTLVIGTQGCNTGTNTFTNITFNQGDSIDIQFF